MPNLKPGEYGSQSIATNRTNSEQRTLNAERRTLRKVLSSLFSVLSSDFFGHPCVRRSEFIRRLSVDKILSLKEKS